MRAFLSSFGILTEKEIEEVIDLGKTKTIRKGEFYIREGQICKEVAFINKGIFRSYYYTSEDEEITYCLRFPETFVSAYSSFITQSPTNENIQAISDAEIFSLPYEEVYRLEKSNRNWLTIMKKMTELEYLEMEQRIFILQKEKAEIRYNNLLKNHPEYLQEIPLSFLASYLGITQRHLSRIRKAVTI